MELRNSFDVYGLDSENVVVLLQFFFAVTTRHANMAMTMGQQADPIQCL